MRLQYIDLNQPVDPPKGHLQNIAMDEVFDEPNLTKGFYLRRRQDGFWLRGYQASISFFGIWALFPNLGMWFGLEASDLCFKHLNLVYRSATTLRRIAHIFSIKL